MRAIRKVTSGELLMKLATRKKSPVINNKYMMKPDTCEICYVLMPSISSLVLLKHCDPNQFFR
jgi:hypothetical protein